MSLPSLLVWAERPSAPSTHRSFASPKKGVNSIQRISKIKRGDVVEIVNDDADLLHHAYVESDQFNFDSGDQQPGSKVDIKFTVAGDFMVLCGIHPKVNVRARSVILLGLNDGKCKDGPLHQEGEAPKPIHITTV